MLLRRSERFQRFGFYTEFPQKKYFRNTSYFGWQLLFALFLIFIITKVFKDSKEPVDSFFAVFTYTVASLGFVFKMIFSIIFP